MRNIFKKIRPRAPADSSQGWLLARRSFFLIIMHEYAINNKATKDLAPMPPLTDQLSDKETSIMASQNIPKPVIRYKDLTGQKFGKLTVKGYAGKNERRKTYWLCECECGNIKKVRSDSLRDKSIQSCGCLVKERNRERTTVHNMTGTPIYHTWDGMIQRCTNPQNTGYKWYGGRGIKVCERWHTFKNFYKDMGERPEGKTIDRWPDNDGNYEPGNCRWATIKEQNNNQRDSKKAALVFWF